MSDYTSVAKRRRLVSVEIPSTTASSTRLRVVSSPDLHFAAAAVAVCMDACCCCGKGIKSDPVENETVQCSAPECRRWGHANCLGLSIVPKRWSCLACRGAPLPYYTSPSSQQQQQQQKQILSVTSPNGHTHYPAWGQSASDRAVQHIQGCRSPSSTTSQSRMPLMPKVVIDVPGTREVAPVSADDVGTERTRALSPQEAAAASPSASTSAQSDLLVLTTNTGAPLCCIRIPPDAAMAWIFRDAREVELLATFSPKDSIVPRTS